MTIKITKQDLDENNYYKESFLDINENKRRKRNYGNFIRRG